MNQTLKDFFEMMFWVLLGYLVFFHWDFLLPDHRDEIKLSPPIVRGK